jgi:hypothetical protein
MLLDLLLVPVYCALNAHANVAQDDSGVPVRRNLVDTRNLGGGI